MAFRSCRIPVVRCLVFVGYPAEEVLVSPPGTDRDLGRASPLGS